MSLERQREKQREYSRRWRNKPGNRELQRERERKCREANPELYQERNRRYRDKVRALLVNAKNVPCAKCGGRFPPVCMDFHHREGADKCFDVGDTSAKGRGSRGLNAVLAEIGKCDVLCANCHRIISHT